MSNSQIIPCPDCGAQNSLTDEYLAQYGGEESPCRQCGRMFVIPLSATPIPVAGAPVPVLTYRNAATQPGAGVWREGRIIVASKDVIFPARCVKCNEPAHGKPKRRKLYWHHPAIYFVILANIIIYAIVAMCVRKTGVVHVSMCKRHKRKRALFMLGGWLSVPVSVPLFIAAGVTQRPEIFVPLGMIVVIGGLVAGIIGSRIVYPSRIDGGYLWLKGAGPLFLDTLPDVHAPAQQPSHA